MKQKKLTMGIMAAFVASTVMTGCEEAQSVHNVTSIDSCVAATGDYLQCQSDWDAAQSQHLDVAPRFVDNAACSESFGDDCQQAIVTHADGSQSSVFLPMMAGMMIGNMMSNSGGSYSHVPPKPLYQEKERRGGGYVPVSHLTTSNGHAVSKGTTNVSKSFASQSTSPKASSTPIARGGFGVAGRGGSAAS